MADTILQQPPLDGDVDQSTILRAFLIWVVGLATVFVVLRVIVRTRIVKLPLWWDDIFIICADVSKKDGGELDCGAFSADAFSCKDRYTDRNGQQPRAHPLRFRQASVLPQQVADDVLH